MTGAEVPDTTVLIAVVRNPALLPEFLERVATGRVWLSSVVVAEFAAGTRGKDDRLLLRELVTAFGSNL